MERHLKELDVLSKHEELKAELKRATEENTTQSGKIKELESEIEKLRDEKTKCEEEKETFRAEWTKKLGELAAANKEIDELKRHLADCEAALPKEPPKRKRTLLELAMGE